MVSISDYRQSLKKVRSQLQDETERIIERNEAKIESLNITKIESGIGSDDKLLQNRNPLFTGRYTLGTQLMNPSKRAGDLYTFFNTGAFLSNFTIELSSDLTKLYIYSTGTGSGEKAEFFKGYDNLYGLDEKDALFLNYEIILPELRKFINENL